MDEERVDGVNWAGLTAIGKSNGYISSAFIMINSVFTSTLNNN